eukprot:jgi/Chlat1/5133/Chrsp33S05028
MWPAAGGGGGGVGGSAGGGSGPGRPPTTQTPPPPQLLQGQAVKLPAATQSFGTTTTAAVSSAGAPGGQSYGPWTAFERLGSLSTAARPSTPGTPSTSQYLQYNKPGQGSSAVRPSGLSPYTASTQTPLVQRIPNPTVGGPTPARPQGSMLYTPTPSSQPRPAAGLQMPSSSTPAAVQRPAVAGTFPSIGQGAVFGTQQLTAAARNKKFKATFQPPPQALPSQGPAPALPFKAEATPAKKRVVKRKQVDSKLIPERIAALLPESRIYTQLLELEKQIDDTLTRKKLEIQEALHKPVRVPKILRLYIFNTHANQTPRPSTAIAPEPIPSWTLRIVGRILEDGGSGEDEKSVVLDGSGPRLSQFFRKVTVELDPAQYPGSNIIQWDSSRATSQTDGFEIKRRGSKEFTAKISIEMLYTPPRFKLSPQLSALLGLEVDTRSRIIFAIWEYIKKNSLQDATDPTLVNCDAHLQHLFGTKQTKFVDIAKALERHLSSPDPIIIEYPIRLTGPSPVADICYDITVDAPLGLEKEMNAFLAGLGHNKEIELHDERVALALKKIQEHKRRRAFFLGFSHSPVDFINGLVVSQTRDLQVAKGETARNAERERKSSYYSQPWVEDAVVRYLHRRMAGAPSANGK